MKKALDFLKGLLMNLFVGAFILFQVVSAAVILYYLFRFLLMLLPIIEPR